VQNENACYVCIQKLIDKYDCFQNPNVQKNRPEEFNPTSEKPKSKIRINQLSFSMKTKARLKSRAS
jgi:hypothetical protein